MWVSIGVLKISLSIVWLLGREDKNPATPVLLGLGGPSLACHSFPC